MPLGEDDDPRLWAKFFFHQPSGQRHANIHVRAAGNPNQRYPLLFRDYLRAHPNSARTVELIKRQLARYHADDVEAYYDIKDPVYDLIWDAAQEWARHDRLAARIALRFCADAEPVEAPHAVHVMAALRQAQGSRSGNVTGYYPALAAISVSHRTNSAVTS